MRYSINTSLGNTVDYFTLTMIRTNNTERKYIHKSDIYINFGDCLMLFCPHSHTSRKVDECCYQPLAQLCSGENTQ